MNMKNIVLLIAITLIATYATAQEYKVARSSGTLELREVNKVTVEGHSGNDIIFVSRNDRKTDERAKGLRAVSSMGIEDNTGLGLSVIQNGEVVEVRQMKRTDGPEVTVRVPKGVRVVFRHSSPYGSDLKIRNFDGAVEVSTVHNSVTLENLKGPLDIRTVHGNIDATLNTIAEKTSLTSIHGRVDLSIPVGTKATLKMSSSWGEILVDPDLKMEVDRSGDMVKYSDQVTGKLNGGGATLELSSQHSNVYLRKR